MKSIKADNMLVFPANLFSEANITEDPLSNNSHSVAASLESKVPFFTIDIKLGLLDSLPELPHQASDRLFIL